MSDIDDLCRDLVTAMKPVLERFVADTRADAERATSDKVKAAIGQFLAGLNTDHIAPIYPVVPAEQIDRVMPGTVKPALQKFMQDHGGVGMSVRELVTATGFKFNSVRGTMWGLARDGEVELRAGKYYPKSNPVVVPGMDKPAP